MSSTSQMIWLLGPVQMESKAGWTALSSLVASAG